MELLGLMNLILPSVINDKSKAPSSRLKAREKSLATPSSGSLNQSETEAPLLKFCTSGARPEGCAIVQ